MAGRQMSALAHLGANTKQKPTLSRHQDAIATTAGGDPYPQTSSISRTSIPPAERRRQKSMNSSPVTSPSGTQHETGDMIIDHNNYDYSQRQPPGSFHAANASSSDTLGRTPQVPLPFNSGAPLNQTLQPEHRVSDPALSPTNPLTHDPADTSTSSPSPATPTNSSPIRDTSTRLSAIQTVQTYLTQEAQAIQSHLTAVLPSLIQGEVRIQCAQLAQEIGAQISSIRQEVFTPTEDQDDPMLQSREEGENEDSRGRGKRSARCSRLKGKRKEWGFATESDNEIAQQLNIDDEADVEDGNESGEEINAASRKYKKQMQALREPLRAFLLQKGLVAREEHGLPVLPLPPCAPANHVNQFVEKHTRTGPDPDNIQYNWRQPLGKCPWNRQATLLLAQDYLKLYREGGIKLNHLILPYNPKVDLKTIQKTIRLRLFRTQTYWKDLNLPNNNTSPRRDNDDNDDTNASPRTMQERAEGKVTLTRRRMRGNKLLKQREANVEKYLNGDLKEELLNMLQHLHSAGMNYDITDSESPDRALQPCVHWWLSPDVISILEELDTLGKRAKALRLVAKKGNRPLPRTKNTNSKIVYDTTKTTTLPKNWYRREWYESLCPFEQSDLNCADPEILPSIQDIHAAIQYLLTGGSSQ